MSEPPRPVRQAQPQEALHDDLAGQRRGHRRVQAGGQQRHREERRGDAEAEQRRQQLVGLADLGHVWYGRCSWKATAATIRIEALTNSASISAMVESVVAHLIASRRALVGARVGAGLHDRGVQIEVVRHHGGADDADGDVEHRRVGDDLARGDEEPAQHRGDRRRGGDDLDRRSRPKITISSAMTKASRQRKPRFIR